MEVDHRRRHPKNRRPTVLAITDVTSVTTPFGACLHDTFVLLMAKSCRKQITKTGRHLPGQNPFSKSDLLQRR